MSSILDGNLYPINFRLHDNRYANSPRAVFNGGGVFRSDVLAVGEITFDPPTRKLMVGLGGPRAYNVMAADMNANMVVSYVPLKDEFNNRVTANALFHMGLQVVTIDYRRVKFRNAITFKAPGGADVVRIGHGHMLAAVAMMQNISHTLRALILDDLTNLDVANLFVPPSQFDMVNALHSFSGVYGSISNILPKSEDLTAVTNKTVHSAVVITPDQLIAPDQTESVAIVSGNIATLTANTCFVRKLATVDEATVYCGSVLLKKGTSPVSSLGVAFTGGTADPDNVLVTINWTTLDVTVTGSDASWRGGVIPLADGFYRLWGSGPSQDHDTMQVTAYVRDQGTTHVSGENVAMWGFMAHRGSVPEAYIKTI